MRSKSMFSLGQKGRRFSQGEGTGGTNQNSPFGSRTIEYSGDERSTNNDASDLVVASISTS